MSEEKKYEEYPAEEYPEEFFGRRPMDSDISSDSDDSDDSDDDTDAMLAPSCTAYKVEKICEELGGSFCNSSVLAIAVAYASGAPESVRRHFEAQLLQEAKRNQKAIKKLQKRKAKAPAAFCGSKRKNDT